MFENIKADIGRYRRYGDESIFPVLLFRHQGLWAVVCYRIGRWLEDHRLPFGIRHIVMIWYHVYWMNIQVMTGIYISPSVRIGKGFYVAHFGQIFLGGDTVIGEDCNVAQGVTLGYSHYKGEWGVPSLGDGVFIAPGAKIIGPVHLASGTLVAANAVVKMDTEENAVVAGVPAKVINHEGSARFIG